jgi:pilus assembly protein CpaE
MSSPGPGAETQWKPLIVCPNAVIAARLQAVLAELGAGAASCQSEYPRGAGMNRLLADVNVCFLDVGSDSEQAQDMIAAAAPSCPVVALNAGSDADLILRCLRRGAREFLSEVSAAQVRGALDRLSHPAGGAENHKAATVYCVVPGKPGCGASTLASSLGGELRRAGVSKVLLVDADTLAGSISFLFKLKPAYHLGDAARDWKRLDDDLWARLVTPAYGMDVLAAPDDPSAPVELDSESAAGLVDFWRERYEAIVVDVPGVWGSGPALLPLADEILLVTTNELAALHATRRSLEYMERKPIERRRLRLVVNRYLPATGLRREDLRTALKVEPYALLNNDYEAVQGAVLDGRPVAPHSQFGRSMHALAERLSGRDKEPKARRGWFGLLAGRSPHVR